MKSTRLTRFSQTIVGLFSLTVWLWSCGAFASVQKSPTTLFYDAQRKLTVKIQNSDWIFFTKEDYVTQDRLFMAQSKNSERGGSTLTFRADETDIATAKKYADKWLKEYPKFGFELQSSGQAKYGNLEGFEIELINKSSYKKIKQFITKTNQEAWVFTCTANSEKFLQAWTGCKKILSTAHLAK